ncbi:MAG: alpha/beta hydrolase family protein [Nevskiales bacterium]
MNELRIKFSADDGYRLAGTLYETRGGQNEIGVLVNAGAGLTRELYGAYARFLAEQGFTVLTYDYRGIGDSRDPDWRGAAPTVQDWAERDLPAAIDWLRGERPQYSLVCVGHSFGGAALGLAWNNHAVRALLGIGAQSSYYGHWPWPRLLQWARYRVLFPLALRYRTLQRLARTGMPPSVLQGWVRWCRDPNYFTDADGRPLRQYFQSYRGRIRLYCFSDDRFFAPRPAVEALAAYYPRAGLEMVHVKPSDWDVPRIGHFGFFRPGMPRRVWQETTDWLLEAGRMPKTEATEV